jgi:hypothetical protein
MGSLRFFSVCRSVQWLTMSGREFAEGRRVELKVCLPHQPVRLISARLTGPVGALQTLWPEAPKRFIFNGLELLHGMTFDFYGIRDGDSIVALPLGHGESIYGTSSWLNATRDIEAFNEALKWMFDPATSDEAARLRDLHLMRLERRPKGLVKMYSSLLAREESNRSPPIALRISYAPALAPSTEPLPELWAVAAGGKRRM